MYTNNFAYALYARPWVEPTLFEKALTFIVVWILPVVVVGSSLLYFVGAYQYFHNRGVDEVKKERGLHLLICGITGGAVLIHLLFLANFFA